jgi:hypothetical protein
MAKSPPKDRRRRFVAPEAIPAYEAWRKDWAERHRNPDRWEQNRTEKIREFRLRYEAQEEAMQTAWSARLDRPWRERDIFTVHEIATEFARVPGSVEIDEEKQSRVLLDLVDWVRRGEAEFVLWAGYFKPFEAKDRDFFSDDLALLSALALFATRAAAESFFQHHERPFPLAWSAHAELPDRTKVETCSGEIGEPAVSTRTKRTGSKGRKLGSGSFDDAEPIREMLRLLASKRAASVNAAATCVVASESVKWTGSAASAVRRLGRKFTNRFGTEAAPGKTWSDIEAELESK